MLVFKMTIAVERINFYTMGIILPRDSNLNVIPFFEDSQQGKASFQKEASTSNYDFQTCLQICSLLKNQIERLEQIERQLTPYQQVPAQQSRMTRLTSHALQDADKKSVYFSRLNQQDYKELLDFRERFDSQDSKERVKDIFKEFSDESTNGNPMHLRVNLHLRLMSLSKQLAAKGYHVTFQMF
jgi:hypothetical protein